MQRKKEIEEAKKQHKELESEIPINPEDK